VAGLPGVPGAAPQVEPRLVPVVARQAVSVALVPVAVAPQVVAVAVLVVPVAVLRVVRAEPAAVARPVEPAPRRVVPVEPEPRPAAVLRWWMRLAPVLLPAVAHPVPVPVPRRES
jgi:hypothetical protein